MRIENDDIPAGWSLDRLDDLATRGSGHTPDKKRPDYWNGGIRWVSLADSGELDKRFIDQTDKEISQLGLKNSSAVLHPARTVILSRDAGVGKSAMLAREMAVSQHFIAWRCEDRGRLDPAFLYYWLQSRKAEFERIAVGSTIKTIGLPYFKKLRLLTPPYCEQSKIAEVLWTWDDAIDAVQKLIANRKTQKKALVQQLLTGQTRVPKMTAEWKSFRLGELFTERSESGASDLPLLSITGTAGVIDREEVGRKDTSSQDKSKYRLICPGDIGYNTMRMWQGVSGLSSKRGIVSPAYTVVTPRPNSHGLFMAYLFKLPRTIYDFRRYSQGLVSDTWNLKFRHFKEIPVKVPGVEEQKRIAEILELADRELRGFEKQAAKLQLEKRALMQQLLTGKRRVKAEEREHQQRTPVEA